MQRSPENYEELCAMLHTQYHVAECQSRAVTKGGAKAVTTVGAWAVTTGGAKVVTMGEAKDPRTPHA